jgi:sarcosine oxidase subunit beta
MIGRGYAAGMNDGADVLVVGAGVQGASLAFHLARRGASVLVVERSTVAAGATGRSSGFVRAHYDLVAESAIAWASLPWFREWAERVGYGDPGFVQTGFLQLVGPAYADALRGNVANQRSIGIETEVVSPADARRLAPAMTIADDELAAYEPGSGYADPTATAAGFLAAARAAGARYLAGTAVTGITTAGGRVTGVETSRGPLGATVVVDAAGAWAGRLAAMVGLEIPISTWRHDTAYLGLGGGIASPFPIVIDHPNEAYFRPEGRELMLVGLEDANEIGGSPDRPTGEAAPSFPERVAERITRRLPAMQDGTFHSAHSGQDGITPDQRAILGPAGPEGFILLCGFSGTGFKTAPAIGLAMSELILDGAARTIDIAPFSPTRFSAGRPLRGEYPYEALWH